MRDRVRRRLSNIAKERRQALRVALNEHQGKQIQAPEPICRLSAPSTALAFVGTATIEEIGRRTN